MKTERESFHRDHDKNDDGKMDASEIMSWIIPDDYDHTIAETQHLLQEADSDKVCTLTLTPTRPHPHPHPVPLQEADSYKVCTLTLTHTPTYFHPITLIHTSATESPDFGNGRQTPRLLQSASKTLTYACCTMQIEFFFYQGPHSWSEAGGCESL